MSVEEREGLEELKEIATAQLEAVNLKLAASHAKLQQQKRQVREFGSHELPSSLVIAGVVESNPSGFAWPLHILVEDLNGPQPSQSAPTNLLA
jgi:hypothetical protein